MEETQILERAFDISADSVYGVLVGLLVALAIFLFRRITMLEKEVVEISRESVKSLSDAVAAIERMDVAVAEMREKLLNQLFKSIDR